MGVAEPGMVEKLFLLSLRIFTLLHQSAARELICVTQAHAKAVYSGYYNLMGVKFHL